MVEVFKTNVQNPSQAEILIKRLLPVLAKENSSEYSDGHPGDQGIQSLSKCRINFDLDDCDNVLRVEAENICPEKIIVLMKAYGFRIEILE